MTKTSEQTLEEFLGRSPTRMEELYTEALGYPVDLLKPVARKTKPQRLEIKKQKLVNKQLERIKKGRTRGAGQAVLIETLIISVIKSTSFKLK